MTRAGQGGTERQGVGLATVAFERIGMAFREQNVHDFGIDAHTELLDGDSATGQLLAVQLKTGPSYFKESTDAGVVFRANAEHFEYWCKHALPVIVVLCEHEREILIWQRIALDTAEKTGKGWKVVVPAWLDGSPPIRETVFPCPSRPCQGLICAGRRARAG